MNGQQETEEQRRARLRWVTLGEAIAIAALIVSAAARSGLRASAARRYPTISSGLKKKSISIFAFSSLSEPWTELASIDSA